MADSLKTRVGRVIAGGVHALIDRIEDQAPEGVMEQSIRDANAVINDVRHELGTVSANRHLAQQQHANLNGQHEKLVDQVEQAMTQSRDDLVRAGVARQLDIEVQIPVLEATLAEYARKEGELQGYVAALLAKKREMEEALADYRKSRAASTASTPTSGAAGAKANAGGASPEQRIGAITGAFDRVHQRQTGLIGTAAASGMQEAAKLKELDDLARDHKIAERMAQLKAKRT